MICVSHKKTLVLLLQD